MEKILFTLLFAFTVSTICNAQQIERQKSVFGYTYSQDGERLSKKGVQMAMQSNTEAYYMMKSARGTSTWGGIFEFAGGFMMGYTLGEMISSNPDPNYIIGGAGLGLSILGVVMSLNGDKKAKKAIDIYNASLNSTSAYKFEPEFDILANGNGIGLSMRF